jgi:hypothetical protein
MAVNRVSPKIGKVLDLPNTPTVGTATAGVQSASVAFTAATLGGPSFSYRVVSNPGSVAATGTTSPITVSGLTGGTSYTFTVRAENPSGNSDYSSASNSATPTNPTYDVILGIASSPYVYAYQWSNGFGTKYADPSTLLSATVAAVSFAGNKSAVLCGIDNGTLPQAAYAWSNGWGSKYADPSTNASGRQLGASFHPNNNAVATGGDGSHVNAWAWSSGFGTKYSAPASAPGGGFAVRYNPSGSLIAVSNNSASPYLAVYDWSSGFGSKYSNPGTLPSGATYGTAWTSNSNAILFTSGSSPYVVAYPWSSGFGTKYSNPSTALSTLPGRVSNFNSNNTAWAGAGNGASAVAINAYAWSSGFGTKYADPATTPGTIVGENTYFTPDDSAVILTGQGDGTTNVYAWAWTNGSGFGTKYANPATVTNSRGYGMDVK